MIEGLSNLNMATLGQLTDGLVGKAVDQAIEAIRRDLMERRRLAANRGLLIKVTIAPLMDADGKISDLDITCEVASKLPPATLGTRALLEEDSELQFRARVPENARQGHLADELERAGETVPPDGEVIKLNAKQA